MVSLPLFTHRKKKGSPSDLTSEDALTKKNLELTRTKQYASGGSTNSAYFVMQSGWKLSCSRNDIANTPRRCSAYDRYENKSRKKQSRAKRWTPKTATKMRHTQMSNRAAGTGKKRTIENAARRGIVLLVCLF